MFNASPRRRSSPGASRTGPDRRHYRELQRKHLFRLLLTYLVPLIVLTFFFLLQYRTIADESRRLHLRSIAEHQANTLDLFLRERLVNVSNLIRDPQLPLPPSAEQMRRCLAKLKLDSESFVDVGFFDSTGVQIGYAGPHPELERRDYSQEPWFTTLRNEGEGFIITDIYLGFRGTPHFTIAVGRMVNDQYFAFRATLDPQQIYEYVTAPEGSEATVTFIINQDGHYQLAPSHAQTTLERSSLVPPSAPHTGTQTCRNNGGRVPYAYSWLQTANWALIVQPSARTLRLSSSTFTMILIISACVSVALLCIIWVRAKKLVEFQREADQTKAQLEHAAKLASVGELAGGVAHDFGNLLMAISAYASLAKDALPEKHEALPSLRGVEEAAELATGVIRSLLSFSQKTGSEKVPVELCGLVKRCVHVLRRVLPKTIEVIVDVPDDGPLWVCADSTQLQQVIINLAINARDAMPDGGTLRISVSQSPAAEEEPTANESLAANARLVVSDTGTGMVAGVRERMFEPFFTTKPRGRGTGLGLAIIRGIVDQHGGRIEVQSELARGTTITVVLPLLAEAVAPDAPELQPAAAPGRGAMVLVAEDSEHVRGILTWRLKSCGYEVVQAADGASLLECFEQHRALIRLLVIDIDLPKRSGLDCLRLLRARGVRTPAILITASPQADLADNLDEDTLMLYKPFAVSDLLALASSVLGARPTGEGQE
jgi:two-component system NtrC family sensor kinase